MSIASCGLSHDCHHLQQIGAKLIAAGWDTFARQVLARAGWSPGEPVVVDGVRHQEAVTTLRAHTTPLPVIVVYLNIAARDGIARARQRNGLDVLVPSGGELHPLSMTCPRPRPGHPGPARRYRALHALVDRVSATLLVCQRHRRSIAMPERYASIVDVHVILTRDGKILLHGQES